MQHVVFVAPEKLQWRETADPILQSAEAAIVRPIVVGRCDLDVLYVRGRMPLTTGEPIGHEIIAEVVELGAHVKRFQIGQRVIVAAQISCGTCSRCRVAQTGRCEAVPFGASFGMGRAGNYGGGLAELIRVPFADAMMVPLPINADPIKMIGLADMATDAWRAVGPPLSARPGATVLVLGGATPVIGIYSAAMAVSLGASFVCYVDADAERCAAAKSYGADTCAELDSIKENRFDVIVDAGGNAALLLQTLHMIAPEAVVTTVAPSVIGPEFPMLQLYMQGMTFKVGRPNCRSGHDGALQAWSTHGFDPHAIAPKVFDFKDACEAWCDPSLYVAVSRPALASGPQS